MRNILNDLTDNIEKTKLEEIANKIVSYYKEKGRHSYSEVSAFIYTIEDDDIDYLLKNLMNIRIILTSKEESDSIEASNKIFKLIDHIQLESARENHIKDAYVEELKGVISVNAKKDFAKIKKLQASIENQQEINQKKIEEQKKEIADEFKKQTHEIDKINSNLISVLGIFGAIIVAFFGGLNLLGSVLDNMNQVSKYRLVSMSIICLTGLFNIIFMLFHCISKLTGTTLWSSCKINKRCSMHETNNNRIICVYEKYPLVVIYNFLSMWLLINIVTMYTLDKYNFITNLLSKVFNSFGSISTVITGLILMILFQGILIGTIKLILKVYKSNCDCTRIQEESNLSNGIRLREIVSEEEQHV